METLVYNVSLLLTISKELVLINAQTILISVTKTVILVTHNAQIVMDLTTEIALPVKILSFLIMEHAMYLVLLISHQIVIGIVNHVDLIVMYAEI
jgi:hypothetical protein